MKSATLKKIKSKLEQEEHDIKSRLAKITERDAHEHGWRTDFPEFGSKDDENAAEVATFQDNVGLEKDLQHSLDEVRQALKRIDDGTYGRCERCGQEIDAARLAAFPPARRCLKSHA